MDVRIRNAFDASHLVKKQAVSEFGEVHVTGDEILAQRYVGRFAEEGRKAVDEADVARGGPGPPMPHLNAVAVPGRDTFRPRIDDEGHAAIPFPADGDDLVEIVAGDFQSAPAPLLHEIRIQTPFGTLASQADLRAERRAEVEVVAQPEGREIVEKKLADVKPVKRTRI